MRRSTCLLRTHHKGERTWWTYDGVTLYPKAYLAVAAAEAAGYCIRWGGVYEPGECRRLNEACHTRRCVP